MPNYNYNDLFITSKQWVLEAGKNIKRNMHQPLTIDTKSDPNDLVTSLDQETEQFFAKKIKNNFPGHKLFGEEGYGDHITSLEGPVWIIDPIDGTMNFVHQKRNFCISVAFYEDGIGKFGFIYDVMGGNLYTARQGEGAYKNNEKLNSLEKDRSIHESVLGINNFWLCENSVVDFRRSQSLVKRVRGTRSYGSAALEFAYVAEGILDGYLALHLSPWDVAAGIIIVQEVGGVTTNIRGEKLDLLNKSSILVCNKNIHSFIVDAFKEE